MTHAGYKIMTRGSSYPSLICLPFGHYPTEGDTYIIIIWSTVEHVSTFDITGIELPFVNLGLIIVHIPGPI